MRLSSVVNEVGIVLIPGRRSIYARLHPRFWRRLGPCSGWICCTRPGCLQQRIKAGIQLGVDWRICRCEWAIGWDGVARWHVGVWRRLEWLLNPTLSGRKIINLRRRAASKPRLDGNRRTGLHNTRRCIDLPALGRCWRQRIDVESKLLHRMALALRIWEYE